MIYKIFQKIKYLTIIQMYTCEVFQLYLKIMYNFKNSSSKTQINQSFTLLGLCPKGIGGAANFPCVLTNILCFVFGIIGSLSNIILNLFLFFPYLKMYWLHSQYPLRSVSLIYIYIYLILFCIFVFRGIGGAANTTCALKNMFCFTFKCIGATANNLELS